jgi:Domain of unknown function (DUF4424)
MFARNCAFTACLLFSVMDASMTLANDTSAQLATGGLVFTQSYSIEMAKEDLYISPEEVRVNYVFHNSSDKDIETIVAFPMPDMRGSMSGDVSYGDISQEDNLFDRENWMDFKVSQDDVEIQPQLQQRITVAGIDMTDQLVKYKIPFLPFSSKTFEALKTLPADVLADLQARGLLVVDTIDQGNGPEQDITPLWTLSEVYWWKTTFPAGADVKVQHSYKPSVGGTVALTFLNENGQPDGQISEEYKRKYCIDDAFIKAAQKLPREYQEGQPFYTEAWISYILTTGGNWDGPISDFTLTVDKGKEDNYVSFCGTDVKKIGPTTFQMKATDFYPEKDLDILLLRNVQ